MREREPTYPPEYDMSVPCRICGVDTDNCTCPECDACGEQGEPKCIEEHGLKPECLIKSIEDLAAHLDCASDTEDPVLIARRCEQSVYRNSNGITFRAVAGGVAVAAYVEGTDLWFEDAELSFPFTPYAFDEACRQATFETASAWNQTHGCDECPESSEHPGYKTIDPNCPACKGEGTIL